MDPEHVAPARVALAADYSTDPCAKWPTSAGDAAGLPTMWDGGGFGCVAKLIAEGMSLGDMMTLLKLRRGEYSLVEEKLPAGSQFLQALLKELPLPGKCVIAAVLRQGRVMIPRGELRFEVGDEVLAVVDKTSLDALRALFGPA